MERWAGKVAVVTGASSGIRISENLSVNVMHLWKMKLNQLSGIGAAIAVDLVKAGMIVVGLARRVELIEELKQKIPSTSTGTLYPFKCDLQKEEDVISAFKWIEEKFNGVDVLINNAGIMNQCNLIDADNTAKITSVIDTNIMGVVYCTREAFQLMKKRNIDGHVVTINSIGGHRVPYTVNTPFPSFNIYPATKYAVTAMTEVYRQEFQREKTKIKITVSCTE